MRLDHQSFPADNSTRKAAPLQLEDGARVAVMGGGPAGALFSYFLLDMAERAGLHLKLDIYEPRDFSVAGPAGCNMCAGIISESLIQMLAVDGINLPADVVQRGIDTYVLHTNAGSVRLNTPNLEKRIGTVFRGSGPRGIEKGIWRSFDGFLLDQAARKGAAIIRERIDDVELADQSVGVKVRGGAAQVYDLLAVATGVNTNALRLFQPLEIGYRPPQVVQTFIHEYALGQEMIERHLGQHTIHFFLLNVPRLDFAALVPKGGCVTVCALGKNLSKEDFGNFLNSREVRACMPPGWEPSEAVCQCMPRINVSAAVHPFADRMIFLGDSGVSRLYKDGIGAAYRAAKAAATTAIFHGISERDFEQHYWRYCRTIDQDNTVGKVIFALVGQVKPRRFAVRTLIRMAASEQTREGESQRMSRIMWDTFTGSAPYRDIFLRFLPPAFWGRLLWYLGTSLFRRA